MFPDDPTEIANAMSLEGWKIEHLDLKHDGVHSEQDIELMESVLKHISNKINGQAPPIHNNNAAGSRKSPKRPIGKTSGQKTSGTDADASAPGKTSPQAKGKRGCPGEC